MNKIVLALCLTIFTSVFAFAQTTTTVSDEYKKAEFYVGFSNNQVDTGIDAEDDNEVREFFNERESFNGINVSGVANVTRYVGIKGDFSATVRNDKFSVPVLVGTTTESRFYSKQSTLQRSGRCAIQRQRFNGTSQTVRLCTCGRRHRAR